MSHLDFQSQQQQRVFEETTELIVNSFRSTLDHVKSLIIQEGMTASQQEVMMANNIIDEEDEQNECSRIEQLPTLDLNLFAEQQEDFVKDIPNPLMPREVRPDIFTLIRSQLCELVRTLADFYKRQ